MITQSNSYLLLWGIGILATICVVLLIWGFWSTIKQMFQVIAKVLAYISSLHIVTKPTEKNKDESVGYLLPSNPAEAIDHLLISGHEISDLLIFRGISGCPIEYPIKLLNTRPVRLEIVGFTVNILMNDKPVQVIKWDKPDNQTSNGTHIDHPFYIEGDRLTQLHCIRVILTQISTILPIVSPSWGIQGEIRFQGKTRIVSRGFDFNHDYYKLSQNDWDEVKKAALP
jgi:hypothetical protein